MRIKVASSSKATGQLQHAGRQKQGWNPLLPDAKNPFSLKAVFALFPCEILLLGKPTAYGSAKSLCSLPLCCSPVVALSELPMNLF